MNILVPPTANKMYTDNGSLIHCMRHSLGTWNMDTVATQYIPYLIGTGSFAVMDMAVAIRDDVGNWRYLALRNAYQGGALVADLGVNLLNMATGNIEVTRLTGGAFDNANFSSTAFIRGYLWVWWDEALAPPP